METKDLFSLLSPSLSLFFPQDCHCSYGRLGGASAGLVHPVCSRQFIGPDSHEPRLRVHKLTSRTSVGVLDSCCSLVLFAALAALSCWYCCPCCRLLVSTRSICSWHALKQSWNREITDVKSWVIVLHLLSQIQATYKGLTGFKVIMIFFILRQKYLKVTIWRIKKNYFLPLPASVVTLTCV